MTTLEKGSEAWNYLSEVIDSYLTFLLSLEDLKAKKPTETGLSRAWKSLLSDLVVIQDRLKKLANKVGEDQIAHATLDARKSDPIIQYMFQSKNCETHVTKSFAKMSPLTIVAGGLIAVEGDGALQITFEGNGILVGADGLETPIPNFSGRVQNGAINDQPVETIGGSYQKCYLELHTAKNRGVSYPVPVQLSVDDANKAEFFADHCEAHLRKTITNAFEYVRAEELRSKWDVVGNAKQ